MLSLIQELKLDIQNKGWYKMNEKNMEIKKESQLLVVWLRLLKSKTAIGGLIVFLIVVLLAVFADGIISYQGAALAQNAEIRLQAPSWAHIMGTDGFGRDVFARMIHGARVSLSLAIIAVFSGAGLGLILGAVSAYYGGLIDNIIMRFCDIMMAVPGMLMALAIVAALGPGMKNLVIAITIGTLPGYARFIRSVVMSITQQEFVEAAKACGTSDIRIIFKHILPNAMGPIIVNISAGIAGMLIAASGMSFLGLGIQPPQPEWGSMLFDGLDYMRTVPTLVILPGVAIVITALSLNLLGDGLRDALDPKLKD